MIRRTAVLGVLTGLLVVPLPGASAAAPDAQGWWNALHRDGLPQPPAPPGVDAGELLVQGGDLLFALPGVPPRQPQPLAVAALQFSVDPDSTVLTLALPVDGPAVAQDLRAYSAAEPFEPVENGAYEKAPDVKLEDFSQGVLSADGLTLSFPDISRLVGSDGSLSVVLIGGPGDRVVLKPPSEEVLEMTTPSSAADDQPVAEPEVSVEAPPATDPGSGAPGFGVTSGTSAVSSPFAPSASAPLPGLPDPAAAAPPGPSTPALAAPVVPRSVAQTVDDTRTRLLVLLQALLVGVWFGALGYGPFAQLSRFTGLATLPRGAEAVRGVGRFAQVRTGQAPRL